jgi:hypothetical protein
VTATEKEAQAKTTISDVNKQLKALSK